MPAARLVDWPSEMPIALEVLHGDQTGEELLVEALRVLDPAVIGIEPSSCVTTTSAWRTGAPPGTRWSSRPSRAMRETGYGLKAATVTPEGQGDVGSPNAILRAEVGGTVILRTGRRIPGVVPIAGVSAPISVVRMAVDDAYGAKEWREGIGRRRGRLPHRADLARVCREVAEYAFVHAARTRARVFGGPKYTVWPVYEGMLKEEMDAAAARHPEVEYEPQLIDATYALLLNQGGDAAGGPDPQPRRRLHEGPGDAALRVDRRARSRC